MFITTLSKTPGHIQFVVAIIPKLYDEIWWSPITSMRISDMAYWGQRGKRAGVGELSHQLQFFAHTLSNEAKKKSNARNNAALTEANFLVTKCSLQRFSPCVIQTSPDLCTAKLHIYTLHFADLKSNLPGTAIQYFHCNCYIFLNFRASLKIKRNWNKWLCQLHNP